MDFPKINKMGSPPKTVESGSGLRVSRLGFRYSICFSSLAPLQSLFPPFRIGLLVLDRSSNAERGPGGEVEMILNDRTNPIFQKPQTDSVL